MRRRKLVSQINVVPFIDVMLVLLIVFMIATPSLRTGEIELPSVGQPLASRSD
jgi:biopolymer transport protein TolR